ncbi:structure-specific endonuclease subunit Slx4p [[Candida] railenensis]|uniref:Structure-specific endonuclease subunit SLX4 n=1 Tax=[Candida] railenensis TaxID=45579 RepID=A0A9P0QW40_9ASCO|nr:structure-specific endonuclease subunit Slx4p [[Candida] railenensis]
MNGVVDGEEDNPFLESSVNFVSTQMQGRLEELHSESLVQDAQMAKLSQLERFRSFNTSLTSGADTKPKLRKKTAVLKPNKKKSISITNLMKEKYSKEAHSQESKDKLTQFTICSFYSGKKGKVSEIIKRIEREEGNGDGRIKPSEGNPKSDLQESVDIELDDNDKLTYSKREWNLILKKIKVKFPNLSSKTKRSLQNASRQINRQMSTLRSGTDTEEGGMWSQQAGTPTPEELDIEDIRWLYNLSDEQVRLLGTTGGGVHRSSFSEESGIFEDGPFVTTLSQVMEPLSEKKLSAPREDNIAEETDEDHESEDEYTEAEEGEEEDQEEIPNSSPEFSPIKIRSVDSSPKLEVQESVYQKEPISSHQRESLFSWNTLSLPLQETQEKQVEMVNTSSSSPSKHVREPEEIFSSSVTHTPQKIKKVLEPLVVEEIVSSPVRPAEVFKTPVKKTKLPIISNPDSSPTKSVGQADIDQSSAQLHQEQIDSPIVPQQQTSLSSSSVYSTALANFARTDTSLAIPKKRYHTSIVEISGEIELIEDIPENSDNVKIRKIGTRIEPPIDSEDEIADSEEESKPNTSISIIEISREIINNEDLQKGNTSIMQVPSSPRNQFGAILDSDFLKSDEHEVKEAREGRTEAEAEAVKEEIDTFSKMTATQLKESFIKLGLKPVKGKAKMVQVLNELSQHVDLSQKEVDGEDFQKNINNKINDRIQGNGYWYEKVLSFEPIILSDLQNWLEVDEGISLDTDILERYCDIMGITTKVKPLKPLEGRGNVKRRRRKVD